MLKIIRHLLKDFIKNIDQGSCDLTKEEESQILKTLKFLSDKHEKLSKYQAYQYLNISRATFDNYIKQGKLPKGMKQQGFKELFWYKKDLDLYINSYENNK